MKFITQKHELLIFALGLFPIFFITGPFLSDLFVVIFDIFFYTFLLKSQKILKNFLKNLIKKLFVCYYFGCFLF